MQTKISAFPDEDKKLIYDNKDILFCNVCVLVEACNDMRFLKCLLKSNMTHPK